MSPRLRVLQVSDCLYLDNNQVADISPLSGPHRQPFRPGARQQPDRHVTPLAGLTNLVYLALENNQVADISSLAGMSGLS